MGHVPAQRERPYAGRFDSEGPRGCCNRKARARVIANNRLDREQVLCQGKISMEDEAPSYWRATAKPFEPPPAELPSRTDVVVVGAGFTGVSAARVLAERGASVAVLDAQSLGWGASTRNGGMMIVGLKHGPEVLVKQYGEELGRRMFETSIEANRIR